MAQFEVKGREQCSHEAPVFMISAISLSSASSSSILLISDMVEM
jgi:hypothetical protein